MIALYNLAKDPKGTNNLAAEHPEKCRALQGKITQFVVRGRSTPGAPQSNDTGFWPHLSWMTKGEYEQQSP